MKEIAIDIISDPIMSMIVLTVSLIYILILFNFVGRYKGFAIKLEKTLIIILLLAITNINFPLLDKINPLVLSLPSTTLPTMAGILLVYLSIIFILSPRLRSTLNDLVYVASILIKQAPFFCLLILLIALSASWSNVPSHTLKASSAFLGTTAISIYIGKQYNWKELSSFLRISTALIAVGSLVNPERTEKGWKGILDHPITLGTTMALSVVLWYSNLFKTSKIYRLISILIIIISIVEMQLANSAGGFCTFLVLMSLINLLRFVKKLSLKLAFIVMILFVAISIILTILISENYGNIVSFLGRDITLTGRTDIWALVWAKIKQRPWLGYGFQSFWLPWLDNANPAADVIVVKTQFRPQHSHNGFLEIALELGWIGFILFFLSFLNTFRQGVIYMMSESSSKLSQSSIPIILLVFLVMRNISDSSLLGINIIWVYYVITKVRLSIDLTENKTIKNSTFSF